jgi:hypothetical protein
VRTEPQAPSLPRVFDRGSPVHAYWVRRCVGFAVVDGRGRSLGRVRRAGADGEELVVARRFGRRRVDAAAVESIWPHERIMLVSRTGEEGSSNGTPRSMGDETLPWFDLPVAAPAAEEPRSPSIHRIRTRAQEAWNGVRPVVRRGVRSTSETARRDWRRLRVWLAERVEETRRRCARGLTRLAAVVEPHSGDSS